MNIPTIEQEQQAAAERERMSRCHVAHPKKYNTRTEKDPDWKDLPLDVRYERVWSQILRCRKMILRYQKRLGELDIARRDVAKEARKKGVTFKHAFDGQRLTDMTAEIDKDFEGR